MTTATSQTKVIAARPYSASGPDAPAPSAASSGTLLVYFCEQCHMPMLLVERDWLVLLGFGMQRLYREKLLGPPVKVMTCINCQYPNCWHGVTASSSDIYRGVRSARAEAGRLGWTGIPTGAISFPRPPFVVARGLAVRLSIGDLQINQSSCIIAPSPR